ncbi:MAG: extracellular solute-binding protein [Atopobiaceae bacterium]|nr:extracellular solute-binding protein [Atopobiaceae bacterium]
MQSSIRRVTIYILVVVSLMLGACVGDSGTVNKTLTSIRVWTYYNGAQLTALQELVDDFNTSVGSEKGIYVETSNLGSVEDLRDAVLDSAAGKVGSDELPNIVACYADTALQLDEQELIVDIAPYLTQEEKDRYIQSYLSEGSLGTTGAIKIFPVGKSTEVLFINKNDIQPFLQANNISYDDFSTIEGLTKTAQLYYEWTDAKTDEANDGKALCGRDSLANYFFIGAKQLGVDIISYQDGELVFNFDKDVVRRLWDNYYVPFVKGYFCAQGRFRSDDIKTGSILSLIGSSSSSTFFPASIIDESGDEHFIEMDVLPAPQFESGEDYAVQQGAGMSVINTNDIEVEASIEFLKWFTAKEQNLSFSISSGYLPVTKEANDINEVRRIEETISKKIEDTIEIALSDVNNSHLYSPPAFEGGAQFRDILEACMSDEASHDAQQVKSRLAQGMSFEEACAPYVTDERFDRWYDDVHRQLSSIVGQSSIS